jgi:cell division septation protein DedD
VEELEKNELEETPQEEPTSSGSGLNNLLKLLSFGVIAILSYLILTTSLKTCGKHDITYANGEKYGEEEFDEGNNATLADTIISSQDTKTDTSNLIISKEVDTISVSFSKQKQTSITPSLSKPDNKTVADLPKVEVKPIEKPIPTNTTVKADNKATDNNNSILVIAGNYIQESNAKELQKKLAKAGIKNTEVIVFDFSEFHTVIVGRYKDLASAKKMVSTLKSKGFESYTHQKRKK